MRFVGVFLIVFLLAVSTVFAKYSKTERHNKSSKKYKIYNKIEEKLNDIENDIAMESKILAGSSTKKSTKSYEEVHETEIVVSQKDLLPNTHISRRQHVGNADGKQQLDVNGSKRKLISHPISENDESNSEEEVIVVVSGKNRINESEILPKKRGNIIHDDVNTINSSTKKVSIQRKNPERVLKIEPVKNGQFAKRRLTPTTLNQTFSFSNDDDAEAGNMHKAFSTATHMFSSDGTTDSGKDMKTSDPILNFVTKDSIRSTSLLNSVKNLYKENQTSFLSYANVKRPEATTLINPQPTASMLRNNYTLQQGSTPGTETFNSNRSQDKDSKAIFNLTSKENKTAHSVLPDRQKNNQHSKHKSNIDIVTGYIDTINKQASISRQRNVQSAEKKIHTVSTVTNPLANNTMNPSETAIYEVYGENPTDNKTAFSPEKTLKVVKDQSKKKQEESDLQKQEDSNLQRQEENRSKKHEKIDLQKQEESDLRKKEESELHRQEENGPKKDYSNEININLTKQPIPKFQNKVKKMNEYQANGDKLNHNMATVVNANSMHLHNTNENKEPSAPTRFLQLDNNNMTRNYSIHTVAVVQPSNAEFQRKKQIHQFQSHSQKDHFRKHSHHKMNGLKHKKHKEHLEKIGFQKDDLKKPSPKKLLDIPNSNRKNMTSEVTDEDEHSIVKESGIITDDNQSTKLLTTRKKHHRRDSAEPPQSYDFDDGEFKSSVMRLPNPIDLAKHIAGFGVNDNRYGESWFEGQSRSKTNGARKKSSQHIHNRKEIKENLKLAGFGESQEDETSHVRGGLLENKATDDEMQRANQYEEGEKLKEYVEQKTSNLMKKICRNAHCESKDGNSQTDEDLNQYVHGGDEIVAQVSIGEDGRGIQNLGLEKKETQRPVLHIINTNPYAGLKLLHPTPKNLTATAEALREVTADERDVMKKKCECDVSFVTVLKTPGCVEFCKTLLQGDLPVTHEPRVITQIENKGRPLLYDKTSEELIPKNPLLESKTIIKSLQEKAPVSTLNNLQRGKGLLEHVKADIKEDPVLSEVLKERLRKVADTITKAKIMRLLDLPKTNPLVARSSQDSFTLQGESEATDAKPIHINASPELINRLIHHHHPYHHHHRRHHHRRHLHGNFAMTDLNHLIHQGEDDGDGETYNNHAGQVQELTNAHVIHKLLAHNHIFDDGDNDDNQHSRITDGSDDDDDNDGDNEGDEEKALISKNTLLKILHHSSDDISEQRHGKTLFTSENDEDDDADDAEPNEEEYVEENESDEHMMFPDKDTDERHSLLHHHHVMYPKSVHSMLHHDDLALNITGLLKNRCDNGGLYLPQKHLKTQCICSHQYYGPTCKEWNYCYPNPCKNGGQCMLTSEIPYHKCVCSKAFMGDKCQDFNPCDPNPCGNQGTCSHDGKTATCTCNERFKGQICQELNNCYPDPCKNGGVCVDTDGTFKCSCKRGYLGSTCEIVSRCYSENPCENGGKCVENGTSSYFCICDKGFVGPTCKDQLCSPNPCQNGGTCMQKENSAFACICSPWASGDTCKEISPCRLNPCKNGGRCIDAMSGFRWTLKPMQYFCDCAPPYKGSHCERNPCSMCGHNAHCEVDRCVCDLGFYGNGAVCRKLVTPSNTTTKHLCHPNPCRNNGVCLLKKHGGFICRCKMSFLPPFCEESDPCQPNPCGEHGNCLATKTTIRCECKEPHGGKYCDDACKKREICLNNGHCHSTGNNSYACKCVGKWSGLRCQDCSCPKSASEDVPTAYCDAGGSCVCPEGYKIDEEKGLCSNPNKRAIVEVFGSSCRTNPCENGGQCIEEARGDKTTYKCVCPKGTSGVNCAIKRVCLPNPCLNEGTCLELYGRFLGCRCPEGFKTPLCHKEEVTVVACLPSPCQHGATCLPHSNGGYDCICRPRYTGPHCTVDRCRDCDENAKCHQGKCVCRSGFIGSGYECLKKPCSSPCLQFQTCVNSQCQCIPGHHMTDGICIPITESILLPLHHHITQQHPIRSTSLSESIYPTFKHPARPVIIKFQNHLIPTNAAPKNVFTQIPNRKARPTIRRTTSVKKTTTQRPTIKTTTNVTIHSAANTTSLSILPSSNIVTKTGSLLINSTRLDTNNVSDSYNKNATAHPIIIMTAANMTAANMTAANLTTVNGSEFRNKSSTKKQANIISNTEKIFFNETEFTNKNSSNDEGKESPPLDNDKILSLDIINASTKNDKNELDFETGLKTADDNAMLKLTELEELMKSKNETIETKADHSVKHREKSAEKKESVKHFQKEILSLLDKMLVQNAKTNDHVDDQSFDYNEPSETNMYEVYGRKKQKNINEVIETKPNLLHSNNMKILQEFIQTFERQSNNNMTLNATAYSNPTTSNQANAMNTVENAINASVTKSKNAVTKIVTNKNSTNASVSERKLVTLAQRTPVNNSQIHMNPSNTTNADVGSMNRLKEQPKKLDLELKNVEKLKNQLENNDSREGDKSKGEDNILSTLDQYEKSALNGKKENLEILTSAEDKERISDGLISKEETKSEGNKGFKQYNKTVITNPANPKTIPFMKNQTNQENKKNKQKTKENKPVVDKITKVSKVSKSERNIQSKLNLLSSYLQTHGDDKVIDKVLDTILIKAQLKNKTKKETHQNLSKNTAPRKGHKRLHKTKMPVSALTVHVTQGIHGGLKTISGILKKFTEGTLQQDSKDEFLPERQVNSDEKHHRPHLIKEIMTSHYKTNKDSGSSSDVNLIDFFQIKNQDKLSKTKKDNNLPYSHGKPFNTPQLSGNLVGQELHGLIDTTDRRHVAVTRQGGLHKLNPNKNELIKQFFSYDLKKEKAKTPTDHNNHELNRKHPKSLAKYKILHDLKQWNNDLLTQKEQSQLNGEKKVILKHFFPNDVKNDIGDASGSKPIIFDLSERQRKKKERILDIKHTMEHIADQLQTRMSLERSSPVKDKTITLKKESKHKDNYNSIHNTQQAEIEKKSSSELENISKSENLNFFVTNNTNENNLSVIDKVRHEEFLRMKHEEKLKKVKELEREINYLKNKKMNEERDKRSQEK